MKTLVVIPSRLNATRLPQKPLASIAGISLVERVVQLTSNFTGDIAVAVCGTWAEDVLKNYNVDIVITDPETPSGTDRVYEAYKNLGKEYDYIVNLQGDMAHFPENLVEQTLSVFKHLDVDVATSITPQDIDLESEAIVKAAFEPLTENPLYGRTPYFSRSIIPARAKQYYKHIGIYAYKTKALETFVNTKPSNLEQTESLEQLRCYTCGLSIGAVIVEGDFFSVDTPEDVQAVEKFLQNQ